MVAGCNLLLMGDDLVLPYIFKVYVFGLDYVFLAGCQLNTKPHFHLGLGQAIEVHVELNLYMYKQKYM